MKYLGIILSVFLLTARPANVLAVTNPEAPQPTVSLVDFLKATGNEMVSVNSFDEIVSKLEKKKVQSRTEKDFVRHIFSKTHSQLLKRYENEATIDQLFEDGTYNCLTGTILYSLLLNKFGVTHEVIETNYHIFLMVHTQEGDVLIEATDPLNGFIEGDEAITSKIKSYKNQPAQTDKSVYEFRFDLFNAVSQEELLGLVYYNLAVKAYNNQQFQKSVDLLANAAEHYNSIRVNEFSGVLIYAISQSKVEDAVKLQQIRKLRTIRSNSSPELASR